MNIYDTVQNILNEEAMVISLISKEIDKSVERFIEICYQSTGKIILTGMGKSGHVARKISATMASLGTPSFYLHPGEAAHGDLGMVTRDDVLIMVSNSGETDELIQLIDSIRIIGCRLMGVFCKRNSTLEKYCDVTIILPVEKEAGVNNLAPTTSTTVTMAFGDAVALTLSQMRNFKESDFALFHPKGALGKKLLITVGSLGRNQIEDFSVHKEQTIEEVLWVITKDGLGAAVVTNATGEIQGLVSDGDIRRCLEKKCDIVKTPVSQIMTMKPVVLEEDMLAVDALLLMQDKRKSICPIVNGNNLLVGMISIHDILNAGIRG